MGAWKTLDMENERLTRAAAAVGAETLAKLKDLNILVIGCKGTGIETAKNLILSNVGSVMVHDNGPTEIRDLGANFYLTEEDVANKTPRAQAAIADLKSLNPFCKVEVWADEATPEAIAAKGADVQGTGKPFTAIIVTVLLPKEQLFALDQYARSNNMVFVLAINNGVTASIFSDFGAEHVITDRDGEPTQPLALSNCEVITKTATLNIPGVEDGQPVVILTFAGETGPTSVADITKLNSEVIEMDDQTGALEVLNGKKFKVARVEFKSPREAKVDVNDALFKNMLNTPTADCVVHWEKQFNTYKAEFDAKAEEGKKFQKREIMIGNRLALVATVEVKDPAKPADLTLGDMDTDLFKGFVAGGLVNPIKKTSTIASKTLEESLEAVPMPQMLVQESGIRGDGIDIHLAISASLEFQAEHGRWPTALSQEDADAVVKKAQAISDARQTSSKESGDAQCWAQEFSWGFPSGEARPVDSERIAGFPGSSGQS